VNLDQKASTSFHSARDGPEVSFALGGDAARIPRFRRSPHELWTIDLAGSGVRAQSSSKASADGDQTSSNGKIIYLRAGNTIDLRRRIQVPRTITLNGHAVHHIPCRPRTPR